MLDLFCERRRHTVAVLAVLVFLLGSFSQHARADSKSTLDELMMQYVAESGKLTREQRTEFFTFWEKQFEAGLAADTEPNYKRLRMLDELGAIQKELGKPEKAADTYQVMIKEARQINDLNSLVLGLDNAFDIAKAGSDGKQAVKIGEEYIAAAAQQAGKGNSDSATEHYGNALVSVAIYLNRSSSDADFIGDRDKSLQRAVELLKVSVNLDHGGATPTATKLYWLAKTYSQADEKELAAETYGRIASMDQDDISPLWMRKLQIEQFHKPGTLEYCNAIAKVLEDFEKSGHVDEYEITLRHLLGKSYRECGEFEKSSEVLSSLVGKSDNENVNAYNLYLTAKNQLELGQIDAAEDLFRQVIKKYPDSGSATLSETGLMLAHDQRVIGERDQPLPTGKGPAHTLLLLIINVVVIFGLAAFVIYRKVVRGHVE